MHCGVIVTNRHLFDHAHMHHHWQVTTIVHMHGTVVECTHNHVSWMTFVKWYPAWQVKLSSLLSIDQQLPTAKYETQFGPDGVQLSDSICFQCTSPAATESRHRSSPTCRIQPTKRLWEFRMQDSWLVPESETFHLRWCIPSVMLASHKAKQW